MDDQQIVELYDTDLDITLAELSRLSGRNVAELKEILMGSNGRKTRCAINADR